MPRIVTIDNRLIESPHDFSDVNLGAIYTNENAVYFNRVEEIIKRRLALAKIETSVEEFFPRDETQAQRLVDMQARIEAEHKERVEREGSHIGPARARDEVISDGDSTLDERSCWHLKVISHL